MTPDCLEYVLLLGADINKLFLDDANVCPNKDLSSPPSGVYITSANSSGHGGGSKSVSWQVSVIFPGKNLEKL